MQVSNLGIRNADLYYCISKLEPIFHVETLVDSLDISYPIKKYTLLLVKLAKAHTIFIGYPSVNLLHDLRQDFICLLKSLPYVSLFTFHN